MAQLPGGSESLSRMSGTEPHHEFFSMIPDQSEVVSAEQDHPTAKEFPGPEDAADERERASAEREAAPEPREEQTSSVSDASAPVSEQLPLPPEAETHKRRGMALA